MKGFTVSALNGPVVSVCHLHGERISETAGAAKILLVIRARCATCGYKKVERLKFRAFLEDVAQKLPKKYASIVSVIELVNGELDALTEEEIEIFDDWTYCETHR